MEVKCLECGKTVDQTPGKRKKEYCNSTCRTTFWKKKKNDGKPKRGPGRPKNSKVVVETKAGRALAYTKDREDIIADGDSKSEAKSNLKKITKVVQEYEATEFPEKPYPSNWNEMGKVQKLEWLTANPRK